MKRAFTLSLLSLFMLSSLALAEEWNKTYPLTGMPRLSVNADDAEVRIKSCDCKQIQARISWEGYKPEKVKITENQDGDHIKLEVRTLNPHINITLGISHKWIHIDLSVPKLANIEAHTGDGKIEVEGIQGELRVDTGDGGIDITGADGFLHAKSGDGHIKVAGRFDQLDLHTGDGRIEAQIQHGSIIKSAWEVRSGDGRVNLHLPLDFSANLYAKTGDGHIHSDLPLTVEGDVKGGSNKIQGKLNAGGGTLNIQTGDGSIYLERL